ncbi:MAG: type I glyceraldehyde-3-phosphate dehydrogenase [Actinobacteria bacterium]|nr:type I glyceraldehyde-3-phosphate dehydrogenase [Actinomycetota bacterium]
MTVRLGINGFGRIGRSLARILVDGDTRGVDVVAVNEPNADPETLAFLLEHDSVAGGLGDRVEASGDVLRVGPHKIAVTSSAEPRSIPWADHGVDVVVEASGHFRSRAEAAAHLDAGARKVVVSAPGLDMDLTVCMGVNDGAYVPANHAVVSNASCTTNCLAPMARVLDDRFGVQQGFMTTVHAYTTDQALLDQPRSGRRGTADLRRMRAAGVSIVPTSTGASRAVGDVLPRLAGRLDGIALRVPVPNGSIVDFVATLDRDVTTDEVNQAFQDAVHDKSYRGVIEYTEKPLVSHDILGNAASCVFSARDTMASGRVVKVLGWYDNEFGYANRLVDLAELMAV